MMSGPELPYKISPSEQALAILRNITKIVDDLRDHLRLDLNKVHQNNQTMLRNFKLQMQPQAESVSDFSILTNPISRNTIASSDLTPDPSAGYQANLFSSTSFVDNILSPRQQLSKISNFYDVRPRNSLHNLFLRRGTSSTKEENQEN